MILAPLVGTALLLSVATDPALDSAHLASPSTQEKLAATAPLVRAATQCIVKAVTGDPRYGGKPDAQLGDLIVDLMPSCVTQVRAMIDAYDRYYGEGSGRAFFMGPYLDVLPRAIAAGSNDTAR
jgi:hypothetical protein